MAEKLYNQGDVIFKKGDYGDTFFQILEGAVQIVLDEDAEEPIVLTDLTVGQYFGEMAVLETRPRSATAIAKVDGTKLLELSENEMDAYFTDKPEMAFQLIKHLGSRIRSLTKEYQDVSALLAEMKAGSGDQSEGFLKRVRRFVAYHLGKNNDDQPSVEARRMQENRSHNEGYTGKVEFYPAGTIIFREGEPASCMYDIHWGEVGIYTGYGTPNQLKITQLGENKFFGEMGMVTGEPRSATAVVLLDNTTLEAIDSDRLQELFVKNPPKVWMIVSHLSNRLRSLTRDFEKACAEVYENQK